MADQEGSVAVIKSPVEGEAGGSKLERLPAELIQPIFDLLHNPETAHQIDLVRPLSKHLLSYSTLALYRRIKITTFDDLSQLCASTYAKATLGHLVQALNFHGYKLKPATDATLKSLLPRLVEGLLCTSLINLKTLTVGGWDLIGRVVLSERFGREGGRALEKIEIINSFDSIEGSIITALGHLGHLPRLTYINYYNTSLTFIEEDDIPPNLGGFEQLKTLRCGLENLSSPHAIQLASLFSESKLESVRLLSLNLTTRPNFAILDSIPATVTKLTISIALDANFTDSIQPPLSLNRFDRFHKLQELQIFDRRIFDEELVNQLITLSSHSLVHLEITRKCQVTFQLLHRFLSGLIKDTKLKKLSLYSLISVGTVGLSYKNGAIPVLENDILVPGAGWKRPDWTWISLLEAQEVKKICEEKGVELIGAMKQALEVEEAFKKEESIIQKAMDLLRDGGQGWVKLG